MQVNRRREQRKALIAPVGIAFYDNGELHHCAILDLSSSGACFTIHLDKPGRIPVLSKDLTMDYNITMTRGVSKCRGKVQWTQQNGSRFWWGISFEKLSSYKNDPLCAAIRNYCQTGRRRRQPVEA